MAVIDGQMECKLYRSAFSGEVVFQVNTTTGRSYEGVVPKHYAQSGIQPTKDGVDGQIKVRVLSINNDATEARVRVPDSQVLTVFVDKICGIGEKV